MTDRSWPTAEECLSLAEARDDAWQPIGPMTWFGASWDAPLNEGCAHQQTPVGQSCLRCDEPIEQWASGVVMSCVTMAGTTRRPQHLECFIRGGVGSVGHLRGRCSCYGGTEEDPPGLTKRQAALAAVLVAFGELQ
jgi:hypothetical protein